MKVFAGLVLSLAICLPVNRLVAYPVSVCSANSLQFASTAFARLSKQPMTDAAEISICLVSQISLTTLFQPKQGRKDEETQFCMPMYSILYAYAVLTNRKSKGLYC